MTNKVYNFYTLSASSDEENIRYVGVTTKKVEERFHGHKYCAVHPEKRALPVHKWMYSHYEKGEDIIVKQIDSCLEEEWEEKEQYWIQYYKDEGFILMNLDKGGRGVVTKEMRNKDSIQRSIDRHKKAIIALNKDGSFYKKFDSIKQATEEFGLKSHSAIGNVLNGRSKSSQGYLWIYESDYDPNNKYTYNIKHLGNYIYEFDIDGILLNTYPSARFIDKMPGWSLNGLTAAIRNKTVYHDHYWSYNNEINVEEFESYFKYKEIDSNGNTLNYYRSQAEIVKKYSLNAGSLCEKIKNGKEIFPNIYVVKL